MVERLTGSQEVRGFESLRLHSKALVHRRFLLIEGFRDADAGAEHVNSEHFQEAIRQAPSMLVDTPEILYAELPGTEWSLLAKMSVPESGSA